MTVPPPPRRRWRDLSGREIMMLILIPVVMFTAVVGPLYILRQQQGDLREQFVIAIASLHEQHDGLEADLQRSLSELKCILVIKGDNRVPRKLHRCARLATPAP